MDRKLQRHRADSLRQHGFLVNVFGRCQFCAISEENSRIAGMWRASIGHKLSEAKIAEIYRVQTLVLLLNSAGLAQETVDKFKIDFLIGYVNTRYNSRCNLLQRMSHEYNMQRTSIREDAVATDRPVVEHCSSVLSRYGVGNDSHLLTSSWRHHRGTTSSSSIEFTQSTI